MVESDTRPAVSHRPLIIERIFAAPRDLVWRAWTEPEEVTRWWGPRRFTSPACRIDLRVGGRYLFCMRSPGGRNIWSTGVYRELVPHERIVCTDSFCDEHGNVVPSTHYGLPADYPMEMLLTITFEDHGRGTKLTLTHEPLPAGETTEMTEDGWIGSFEKLEKSLANDAS